MALFFLAISSSSSLICFFVLFFGGFLNLYGSVAIGRVCQFWDFLFAGARETKGGGGAVGGVGGGAGGGVGGVEELWWLRVWGTDQQNCSGSGEEVCCCCYTYPVIFDTSSLEGKVFYLLVLLFFKFS